MSEQSSLTTAEKRLLEMLSRYPVGYPVSQISAAFNAAKDALETLGYIEYYLELGTRRVKLTQAGRDALERAR